MINLKIRINVDEQTLTLPVDTQFVPGIPEKDPVVMVTEITEHEELKYLERDKWNIEEINFLAKRMESFDKREQSQFDAAVSIFRPKTVEALINYTYNLPRFTLISDFSSLTEIGKELMTSEKGIPTAYGVLFVNEDISFEPVYDGRHFPVFDYNGSSVAEGSSVEDHEDEFKDIHDQIEMLEHRIGALREATYTNEEREEKEKLLQKTIEDRAAHSQEYDDTIARQMIECIKIYHDGRIEVIFGGGISIVEKLK